MLHGGVRTGIRNDTVCDHGMRELEFQLRVRENILREMLAGAAFGKLGPWENLTKVCRVNKKYAFGV